MDRSSGTEETALVYNIQHYSLHDGPGIRTIVFFKGCPLRCKWCCNPESQNGKPELFYQAGKCLGQKACGLCASACPEKAIVFDDKGSAAPDRAHCDKCLQTGVCAASCPSRALQTQGVPMTVAEILEEALKDEVFFLHGEGGLTISGGEPLQQGEALLNLLAAAKKRRIHTSMETSGFADYATLEEAAHHLDTIFYDIKSMDDEKHRAFTGQSNRIILENIQRLSSDHPSLPKIIRTPIIPGFNDSSADAAMIQNFVESLPNASWEALAYHRYGIGKYAALGREYPLEQ
jgi:pyruvate formate lyase activating enzyme